MDVLAVIKILILLNLTGIRGYIYVERPLQEYIEALDGSSHEYKIERTVGLLSLNDFLTALHSAIQHRKGIEQLTASKPQIERPNTDSKVIEEIVDYIRMNPLRKSQMIAMLNNFCKDVQENTNADLPIHLTNKFDPFEYRAELTNELIQKFTEMYYHISVIEKFGRDLSILNDQKKHCPIFNKWIKSHPYLYNDVADHTEALIEDTANTELIDEVTTHDSKEAFRNINKKIKELMHIDVDDRLGDIIPDPKSKNITDEVESRDLHAKPIKPFRYETRIRNETEHRATNNLRRPIITNILGKGHPNLNHSLYERRTTKRPAEEPVQTTTAKIQNNIRSNLFKYRNNSIEKQSSPRNRDSSPRESKTMNRDEIVWSPEERNTLQHVIITLNHTFKEVREIRDIVVDRIMAELNVTQRDKVAGIRFVVNHLGPIYPDGKESSKEINQIQIDVPYKIKWENCEPTTDVAASSTTETLTKTLDTPTPSSTTPIMTNDRESINNETFDQILDVKNTIVEDINSISLGKEVIPDVEALKTTTESLKMTEDRESINNETFDQILNVENTIIDNSEDVPLGREVIQDVATSIVTTESQKITEDRELANKEALDQIFNAENRIIDDSDDVLFGINLDQDAGPSSTVNNITVTSTENDPNTAEPTTTETPQYKNVNYSEYDKFNYVLPYEFDEKVENSKNFLEVSDFPYVLARSVEN